MDRDRIADQQDILFVILEITLVSSTVILHSYCIGVLSCKYYFCRTVSVSGIFNYSVILIPIPQQSAAYIKSIFHPKLIINPIILLPQRNIGDNLDCYNLHLN